MARIVYGVAGEGMGHASRSKILIEHLLSQGHQVKVVTHDKGYENLSAYFDVLEVSGLRISYRNNEVKYWETFFSNFSKLPGLQRSFTKIKKLFKEFKPQIIISDFEPMTALLANLGQLPLISIDNQHQLTHTTITYPKKYLQDALAAKTVSRLMVHSAKAYLITSFFKTSIRHSRTFLFPPILRREVMELKATEENFILVYTTSCFSSLENILKKINARFIIYGAGEKENQENLIFKKGDQKEFLSDLSRCQAVIATAGLSLISEALYLGKPYLAIPVEGQFEQILNAYYLEKLGYGQFLENPDQEKIENFLARLDQYKNNLSKYKKEDNSRIFVKLDSLIKRHALRN